MKLTADFHEIRNNKNSSKMVQSVFELDTQLGKAKVKIRVKHQKHSII